VEWFLTTDFAPMMQPCDLRTVDGRPCHPDVVADQARHQALTGRF
jgi:hypothetical protein